MGRGRPAKPAQLTQRFLEERSGGGREAPCLPRAPAAGGGGAERSLEVGEAGTRSHLLNLLWVLRNFRTLPESFQSVKCLGEVGWGGGGYQEWGGAALGTRPSGSCQFLEAGGLASDHNPSYLMMSLVERRLRGLSSRGDVDSSKNYLCLPHCGLPKSYLKWKGIDSSYNFRRKAQRPTFLTLNLFVVGIYKVTHLWGRE